MKNVFKFFGIIAIVAVIGFSMAACKHDDDGGGKELSGTVTVGTAGTISFEYRTSVSGDNPGVTIQTCTFTTNLSGEDASFTLNNGNSKFIYDLTPGQKVNWTAKIDSGSLTKQDDPSYDVCLRGKGK